MLFSNETRSVTKRRAFPSKERHARNCGVKRIRNSCLFTSGFRAGCDVSTELSFVRLFQNVVTI